MFLTLFFVYLLLPLLCLMLFKIGIKIKYHQINSIVLLILNGLSVYTALIYKPSKKLLIPLVIITGISVFSFLASRTVIFESNGIDAMIGMLALHVGAQAIGFFIVYLWMNLGSLDLLNKLLLYSGVAIAVSNIIIFVLLYSANYVLIFSYAEFLGFGDYFFDVGSFFIRPAGYFFDTHSQYYLPLFALIFLVFRKVEIPGSRRTLFSILIIASILLSGIKTAYLSLGAVLLYWALLRFNKLSNYLYLFIVVAIMIIVDSLTENLIGNLLYSIFTHDIMIIIKHFFEVPEKLIDLYPTVFFFGGQPLFSGYVYSEVYYVTIIYYIGFIGLLVLYLFPSFMLLLFSKDVFVKSLVLVFLLSLTHYSVYNRSINIIGTAYIYFHFYKLMFNLRLQE